MFSKRSLGKVQSIIMYFFDVAYGMKPHGSVAYCTYAEWVLCRSSSIHNIFLFTSNRTDTYVSYYIHMYFIKICVLLCDVHSFGHSNNPAPDSETVHSWTAFPVSKQAIYLLSGIHKYRS